MLAATALPWSIAQLGARAEYRFSPQPPRTGGESAAAADDRARRVPAPVPMNRGILMTPFHNMALMCPATTAADVDAHTQAFTQACAELTG